MTKTYHMHEIRDAIIAAEYDSTKEKRIIEELESIGLKFSETDEALVRLTISVYQRIFFEEFLRIMEGKR